MTLTNILEAVALRFSAKDVLKNCKKFEKESNNNNNNNYKTLKKPVKNSNL